MDPVVDSRIKPRDAKILSVENLLLFKDIVHYLLNMCFCDIFSLILTKPHTNQI